MKELEYPFDGDYLLKKSKHIKKQLLADKTQRIHKNIAVLGGSTTHDIVRMLELFLLNHGIAPSFYESEYGQYWQDAMFPGQELLDFHPDVIYIHTSNRNISAYLTIGDNEQGIADMLSDSYNHFEMMWKHLQDTFHCPIIQNNFEQPFFRILGNLDVVDVHGRMHFLNAMNERFYEYAAKTQGFYINDINYLASCYGLDKWSDPLYWHMYKYALCIPAVPALSFNIANIIKSIYGKNKKALVLDLDNTLWGGVIGDDGVSGIEIGKETNLGQVYSEFQSYIKAQKDLGIILNIDSKNEEENALAGLNHPDSILKADDFIYIKANWDPKSKNFVEIAQQMNILPESMVFVDDNPAEREIIMQQVPGVSAPDIQTPENYIRILDHAGFFEVTTLSEDDKKRGEMYRENKERAQLENSFADYAAYLKSLEMKAVIKPFEELYYPRIAQLTNKSNQFNLTTKRFTQEEIAQLAQASEYITLYGRLEDRFGDNGIVSLLAGHQDGEALHMDLWLMSCRVLKRDMEYAMMDTLVTEAQNRKIHTIFGYYYPTPKNHMVFEFYRQMGFEKVKEDAEGNTVWQFDIPEDYRLQNKVIALNAGQV